MACSCAHPAHEHRAISRARGPAAHTQRALKLATAALAATAGVPAPKPRLSAGRLASALTLCASDSVSRCRLQRCELPILMLMLALPTIGLLALRCVGALAPLFILLFSFFDLLTIRTLISQPAALPRAARCSPPLPLAARPAPRPAAARLSAAHPALRRRATPRTTPRTCRSRRTSRSSRTCCSRSSTRARTATRRRRATTMSAFAPVCDTSGICDG